MACEKFIGTWKADKNKRKGYENFMGKYGYTEEQTKQMGDVEVTFTIEKDGDGWKTKVSAGEKYNKTVAWKFGEQFETEDLFGNPAKGVASMDGNCLVEKITATTPKGPLEITVRSTVNGNCMERRMVDQNKEEVFEVYTKC